MKKRFSLGRVMAEAGGLIARRWPMLLMATIALGLILAVVNLAMTRLGVDLQGSRMSVFGALYPIVIRMVTDSLILGLMLGALLSPSGIGSQEGRLAPFRLAIVRLPSVFAAQVVYMLPVLVMILVTGLLIEATLRSSGDLQPVVFKVALLSNIGWLAALMVLAVVGMAPPAAVAEGLGPRAALSRSVVLTRGRGPLLFGLYLGLVAVIVGVIFVVAMRQPGVAQMLPSWASLVIAPVFGALKGLGFAALYLELKRLNTPDEVAEAPAQAA